MRKNLVSVCSWLAPSVNTGVETTVIVVLIAIIAGFTGGGDSVAAIGVGAVGVTSIAIGIISVVAGFKALYGAIAANSLFGVTAVIRAGISGNTCSIGIAIFCAIDDAITTARFIAVCAAGVGFVIGVEWTIITCLIASDDAVSAAAFGAVAVAAITIDGV